MDIDIPYGIESAWTGVDQVAYVYEEQEAALQASVWEDR
jgi:hypothetical protein